MQIFVKLLSGRTVTLDVQHTDTIAMLKLKIQGKENIQASEQRLVYSGNGLTDDKTLGDYDIPNEATIYLISSDSATQTQVLPGAPAPTIQVKAKINTAEQLLFDVNPNAKVQVLIDAIAARIALASDKKILLYLGQSQLNPMNTLATEGVNTYAVVNVVTMTKGGL